MPDSNFQQSGGIFQAGHGGTVQIHGGQFVQHNFQTASVHQCNEADDGFKHLQAHVATSAFDSAEHVDAPKCHVNTRKAVLDEIMNWIILTVTRVHWVLWLNGAAGAGKSAIARSIVDLCIQRNIPIARFFFFRTDYTRNSIKPLVATLPIIIPRIESDSLIFTKSLKTQFDFLIFGPLLELQRSSLRMHTVVLLLDGVDECEDKDDQASLIHIVTDLVGSDSVPVIAFFASRIEDQISTVFRSPEVANVTLRLPLDNNYLPDNDIRLFLDDSFQKIKATHPFGHLLDSNWPLASEVQEIVEKSSGQFIYASVVIKFCSMLGLHPEQQLNIVRGLRPRGALTPFAQLDALYQHIFSQVWDFEVTSLVLAWAIFTSYPSLSKCAEFLGMEVADIYVAMTSLQSVVNFTGDGDIHFLHASLPDFLFDEDRSQEYHISRSTWSTRLSIMAFKFVMSNGDRGTSDTTSAYNRELRLQVLAYDPAKIPKMIISSHAEYLSCVQRLDFGDGPGGTVYRQQLNVIVRHVSKKQPFAMRGIERDHKISDILDQIARESAKTETDMEAEQQELNATAAASPAANGEQQESAAANEEQLEIKKQSSSARKIFRKMWRSTDREAEAQEAGTRGEDGGASLAQQPKSGLSRLFRK
ncbi:hypothetical protein HYPSUDRAFT_208848 [Hypholoma sublateritium FD-334 SS-4]|uniref:NACHT domain-containing protein n=1 Tax=Hypholoma sublateritium (strain FD-334 SS-4) TaxID=945553 RepID=A0A0D2P0T0_HYPSF|nr:hypothetical protein HYPSUDRAFT_208848 [Hypholoma sublateritium FD-334 SS-4]